MPDKFSPFAEPYAPNLVPQTTLGGDPLEQVIQLERYLAEELDRISTAMLFVPVQAAYAALLVDPGPVSNPLTDTPTLITGWNNFSPDVPNRVTATTTGNSLTPLEGGVYLVQAQISATVDTNTTYTITVTRNLVPSGIFGLINAGNQSVFITLTLFGLVELNAGDAVTLFGAAVGPGQPPSLFDMESATFSAIRISELHGRDQGGAP